MFWSQSERCSQVRWSLSECSAEAQEKTAKIQDIAKVHVQCIRMHAYYNACVV